jgi:4-hydroxybutyrate CoA-transferase
MPQFPAGTAVGIPQPLADYVVTEYGTAKLRGKTLRERANELIAIAHPDFRAELRKEAQKLYWP